MAGFKALPIGTFIVAKNVSYAMTATDWEQHKACKKQIADMELIPIPERTTIGPVMGKEACPFGHHAVIVKTPDWSVEGHMYVFFTDCFESSFTVPDGAEQEKCRGLYMQTTDGATMMQALQ